LGDGCRRWTTHGLEKPKPLEIVQSNRTSVVCEHVVRHARRERAESVIVGLPLHKNGSVAEQTEITLRFCRELASFVLAELGPAVPVLLWDERYTSKEAAARAHSRHPGRFLYGTLDAEAACIILEHFYGDNGVGAYRIEVTDDAVRQRCLQTYETFQKVETQQKIDQMVERERKLQRRKDAIARARDLELEVSTSFDSPGDGASGKRKRRKKKR
jgi:RNase H-fold protein (predicted Holliday junction resolvase)